MCLDDTSTFVGLQPVRNCEPVSRSDHQRILSTGFSCLVTELRFAVTLNSPRMRYHRTPASLCQWPRSILHYYSSPTTCHRRLLRGYFECVQLKGVCV